MQVDGERVTFIDIVLEANFYFYKFSIELGERIDALIGSYIFIGKPKTETLFMVANLYATSDDGTRTVSQFIFSVLNCIVSTEQRDNFFSQLRD